MLRAYNLQPSEIILFYKLSSYKKKWKALVGGSIENSFIVFPTHKQFNSHISRFKYRMCVGIGINKKTPFPFNPSKCYYQPNCVDEMNSLTHVYSCLLVHYILNSGRQKGAKVRLKRYYYIAYHSRNVNATKL